MKFNKHTGGKVIETTDEIFQAYSDLKDVKQQLAELSDRKTELEEKIKLGFGDAEALSYGAIQSRHGKAPSPQRSLTTRLSRLTTPTSSKSMLRRFRAQGVFS